MQHFDVFRYTEHYPLRCWQDRVRSESALQSSEDEIEYRRFWCMQQALEVQTGSTIELRPGAVLEPLMRSKWDYILLPLATQGRLHFTYHL